MKTREKYIFFLLIILSIFIRFFGLNYPQEVVFDEVHFFNFVKSYNLREYFFDIHPPLGKLMIALAGKISRFDFKNNIVSHIGDPYNNSVFWLRFVPAFFGMLQIPLIFLFVKEITQSLRASIIASVLVLFSNSLLCQSKFIFIDSQLVFFSLLSLYCFLLYQKRKQWLWLIITGLSCGAAISIKWTGLGCLGVVLLFLFIDWLKENQLDSRSILLFFKKTSILLLSCSIIYILSFCWHFESIGSSQMSWNDFLDLNQEMYSQNNSITERHSFESKWYQWILGYKPIYYWAGNQAYIYLIENPFIVIGGTVSVFLSLLYCVAKKKQIFSHSSFLLVAYFANLLPFMLIKRPIFFYHYFNAFIISIVFFSILLDKYLPRHRGSKFSFKEFFSREYILLILMFIIIATSIYFLPLSYGDSMSLRTKEKFEQLFNPQYFLNRND